MAKEGLTLEDQRCASHLMDHLAKQYACVWEGKTIVVRELQIKIQAPYGPNNCVGSQRSTIQSMNYVKRVIKGVYNKKN